MTTNGGTPALDALAELARQQAEKDGLEAQVDVARMRLSAAVDRAAIATMRLASELDDVARLEQVSMTRILATLRGRRDQDLDRERAEAEAARWTSVEAEERRRTAQVEVDSLLARLAAIGDLTTRRVELLAQREAEVAADPAGRATAVRLGEVATALGERTAEGVQIDEALEAARVAAERLDLAARHLGSAGSWSTYDTFFGGGFFSDMAKYDNLDKAAVLMRQADDALGHLATELADVGMSSVGGIEVSQLTSFFDVWFDNIFSDWAVRDRIQEAAGRVAQARAGVTQTIETLGTRRTACLEASARLADEREELLGA